jgi:hypothetical protein
MVTSLVPENDVEGVGAICGGSWGSVAVATDPDIDVEGADALRVLGLASLVALPPSADETIWECNNVTLVVTTYWAGTPCATPSDWLDGVSHATGVVDMVTNGRDWLTVRLGAGNAGTHMSAGTRCSAESW